MHAISRLMLRFVVFRAAALMIAALSFPTASGQDPELGQGWSSEFNLAARQLVSLAEAIPEEKFDWRPRPGVRSTSEVFMHIVFGNYWLLDQAGGKIPDDTPEIPADFEKKVKAKAEVIRWLKSSLDAVRRAYPDTNRAKTVRFLGKQTTSDAVFLRMLVHNHEHMGQLIAYARVLGVVPPWSKAGPE